MTEMTTNYSTTPLPVELLWQHDWPAAAQLFWARIAVIPGVPREDLAADFWSGEKNRSRLASRTFADLLFATGYGEEALAALMLAADPAAPQSFEIIWPQLSYAIEYVWDWPTASTTRASTLACLVSWSRAAKGDFAGDDRSIFLIVRGETLVRRDAFERLPPSMGGPHAEDENTTSGRDAPDVPGLVVMTKDKPSTRASSSRRRTWERSATRASGPRRRRSALDTVETIFRRDLDRLATTVASPTTTSKSHSRTTGNCVISDRLAGPFAISSFPCRCARSAGYWIIPEKLKESRNCRLALIGQAQFSPLPSRFTVLRAYCASECG